VVTRQQGAVRHRADRHTLPILLTNVSDFMNRQTGQLSHLI